MKEMIKQLPTSVKLAAGFLIFLWALMMLAAPMPTIGFTLVVLTFASVVRVISYIIS